ncbi:hypothetical protein [Synechococcus elongatus]|uniref:Transposase n=1 Tax=Synechococcus elongatus PCC 11802 TaxID=2283154 RepID=A0AAT9JVX6_SYNEL|nr:hypothetical protein [Synechococcus elongatus]
MQDPEIESLPYTDSDSPWKELIEAFFPEFIRFFLPVADPEIDWERGYEFLDKELQQITADAEVSRRYADKLVKVWTTAGTETWVLVHVEVQGAKETAFEERMFVYRYRTRDRFRRLSPSLPMNLRLGDPSPSRKACGAALQSGQGNPFAIAVVAHLRAIQTKKDRRLRKQWKLELLKLLYERGFDRDRIIGLFKFIDWLMSLPQGLELQFKSELSAYEQERRMLTITSTHALAERKPGKRDSPMGKGDRSQATPPRFECLKCGGEL